MEIEEDGKTQRMYQEEWQHFADYENMDQDRQNVPTPTLNVILVCPFRLLCT